jgi:hypothetical protein
MMGMSMGMSGDGGREKKSGDAAGVRVILQLLNTV